MTKKTRTNYLLSKTAKAMLALAYEGVSKKGQTKRKILLELSVLHGKCCHWCLEPVRYAWEKGMNQDMLHAATFDHIKTAQSGGKVTLGNGVLACRRCNNIRGNMKFSTFRKKLKHIDLAAWTEAYYNNEKQRREKADKKKMHAERRVEARRRKKVRRAAWEARSHRLRWYHWALNELSEWGRVFNQLGVAF